MAVQHISSEEEAQPVKLKEGRFMDLESYALRARRRDKVAVAFKDWNDDGLRERMIKEAGLEELVASPSDSLDLDAVAVEDSDEDKEMVGEVCPLAGKVDTDEIEDFCTLEDTASISGSAQGHLSQAHKRAPHVEEDLLTGDKDTARGLYDDLPAPVSFVEDEKEKEVDDELRRREY